MPTTPQSHYLAVFGSLRATSSRGYNLNRCGPQRFIRMLKLEGWTLHSLGAYPAIAPGRGTLVAELHEVDDETFQTVRLMERGAGYSERVLTLDDGIEATIFYMPASQLVGRPKVESGDWN